MKGYVKFFKMLSVVVCLGFTYMGPVYAQDGHSQNDHEMKHGTALNDPEDKIIASYLKIKESLANDTLDGIASEAKNISHQLGLLVGKDSKHSGHKSNMNIRSIGQIVRLATKLSHGKIEDVRKQFAALSQTLIKYLKKSGRDNKLFTFYCPMEKTYWLQDNKKVANPYLGSKMLTCGNIVKGDATKKMMHEMGKNGHEHHNEH